MYAMLRCECVCILMHVLFFLGRRGGRVVIPTIVVADIDIVV